MQLKLFIKTCLVSVRESAWKYIFWIVSLDAHHIGNKKIYLIREPLTSMSLSNNLYKEEKLTIENGGL